MYIKKSKKTDPKTKKPYCTYTLIESVRTERGPRQRVLLYMGTDLTLDEGEHKVLAERIEEILTGQESLFQYSPEIERLAQHYTTQLVHRLTKSDNSQQDPKSEADFNTIDINSIEQSEPRTVGAEHLLLQMANQLELPSKLKELGLSEKEIALSLGTIIARAVAPASERATYSWLTQHSGLEELISYDFQKTSLNNLYVVSDTLLLNKEALEKHLEITEEQFHGYQNTITLYDLTNTYMEGQAKGNPKASHGVSKEKRRDCPLVTLGIAVNEHGFINRTKILPGNASEPKTLEDMISSLGRSEDLLKPTIILDAGISSEDNLKWLRDHGYKYVVSARQKAPSLELEGELVSVGDLQNNVRAALIKSNGNEERWLYCESEAKEAVASQMKTSFKKRFEEDLQLMQASLAKPRGKKLYNKILERIGRLKQKHKQISGCYEVTVEASEDKLIVLSITWNEIPEKMEEKLTGHYFLRTNLEMEAKELWALYNTLRGVEDAFRFMKSALGLRPVYHKKEARVDGHLFISVLAYHLIQNCMYQLKKQGVCSHWKTILGWMSTRVRVTMKANTDEGKTLYHRSTTKAEGNQPQVYKALGLSSQILRATKTIV
jgi:transposase